METKKIIAPYGTWISPITADAVSRAQKRLHGICVDGHGHLLWVESRPTEAGRGVLVKEADKHGDEPIDITPDDFAVRTLVHEYGGQAFAVSGDTVVFSNYKDQRLYKQIIGDSAPLPITHDYGGSLVRYADGVFDSRSKSYVTVMEDHRESSLNPTATIASVSLGGETNQEPKILVGGSDFFAFPRMDLKGERLAWIEWGHPNMQWDKAELWVGYISKEGDVYRKICIAGGDPTLVESPSEPKWSSNGDLFFVTDRNNGFWNIYKWIEHSNEVVPIYTTDAEFTRPFWVFGNCSYDFIPSTGSNNLIVSGSDCIYVEGATGVLSLSIAKVTFDQSKVEAVDFSIMWSSSPDSRKYRSNFSIPEPIDFPTEVSGQKAYAYFYPPSNPRYQASDEEKPPLLLTVHGGPTAETRGILDLNVQYWTSRGWAVVDVNYGGSTGYGREYRERLLGNWGVVDVNDCCSCAKFLVDNGMVDEERLCITGRSAGGYTTLASLAFRHTFKADLNSMNEEMPPKFELHYTSNLGGSDKDMFERSPINFIVTPVQARKIHKVLKQKGLPVALVEYEGEQHRFRKAENIKHTLEQQMMFFARLIAHFKVADEITPIKIDNLD
ncbi:hypothetical protein MKX03_033844 [Papaver bracteatum]|nr:hypothetical protein MKX03_033844 [Papaver bracteatum]